MAAGPGTDVRDAAVVLFTQTATERAHTRAHEQVSVGVCLLLRGYGVFLSFIRQNGSFYCREAQKHESFFHNVDAYGKNKKQPVIVFLRIQEVKELGDLSPHWNELRHDVINHCNHLIGCYQEMLAELDKLSGEVD